MYITKIHQDDKSKDFDWETYFLKSDSEKSLDNKYSLQIVTQLRELYKENKFMMTFAISRVIRNLLKGINIKNPNILELGGATGFLTRRIIQEYGGSGTLVDKSEAAYRAYTSMYGDFDESISYIIQDIFTLDMNSQFDIVCSFGLIEHFNDKKDVLNVHKKFVKDNGYIIIIVPMDSILSRTFFEVNYEMNLGYRELLTEKELRNFLVEVDLDVIDIEISSGYCYDFVAALCKKK